MQDCRRSGADDLREASSDAEQAHVVSTFPDVTHVFEAYAGKVVDDSQGDTADKENGQQLVDLFQGGQPLSGSEYII